ncbi:MAG: tetratricopeptide repeat protein [Candidatus Omnitrophica bacterium]|nr:tetratricopeptide repeat protein [Candidatus Omnitrophota bacterium]
MKKKICFYVIGAFLLAFLFVPSECRALSWQELHDKAEGLDMQQALAALAGDEDGTESLFIAGIACLNAYDNAAAETYFRRILAGDPLNIQARWGMAECYRRQYKFDESVRIIDLLLKEAPDYAPAYLTWAYIQYLRMDFKGAARIAALVINRGRRRVDLNSFVRAHSIYAGAKGMIAHYAGPLSKAVNGSAVIRHLKIAARYAPDHPAVLFGYGSYYLLIPPLLGRNVDKAIDYLERAVRKDPGFVDIYVRLAQAYKLRGDIKRYNEYLDKALELDGRNIVARDVKDGTCRFICVEITD